MTGRGARKKGSTASLLKGLAVIAALALFGRHAEAVALKLEIRLQPLGRHLLPIALEFSFHFS